MPSLAAPPHHPRFVLFLSQSPFLLPYFILITCRCTFKAHAGHPATDSALLLTALHPNLHLDTTPVLSTPIHFPPSTSQSHLLSLVLEGRILFGSDTPTVTHTRATLAELTRAWVREAVARCVGALEIEDMNAEMVRVGEEAERCVFGEAALRLDAGVRNVEEAKADLLAKATTKGKL